MSIKPDLRKLLDMSERIGRCRKCGRRLVLLPDDKRKGFCFECYDPSEIVKEEP